MEKKYHIDYHFGTAPLTFGTTGLIQLGRLYCMPSGMIAKHAHMDWYELTCVTGGKGTVLTNDIPQEITSGDIYLSFPGDFHEIRFSSSDPLKYDFFPFIRNKVRPQNLYVNSADELCYQLMHYIDTHMYRLQSLNDLSEEFGYNYSYLSDLFRKNTGDTLSNYYRTRHLNAARLLLDEKKLRIHQIAEILGYSSLYAFSKAFKHRYGISPEHYLKKIGKGECRVKRCGGLYY